LIARDSHWYRVHQHSYIRDLKGKTWRVVEITDRTVTLVDRDQKVVAMDRPRSGKPVVIVEPTPDDAMKTAQELLDAVVIEEVPTR
jgi:hypothetical protein